MNDKILSYALSFALFISSTSTTFSRELCPKEIQDMQTELKNCEAKRCENPDDFNSCDLAKEQNFLNCRSGVLSKYENLKGNNQICKSDLQEIKEKIESNIQKELLSCDQYKCSEPFSPSVCDFQKEQMFISCRADVISKYQD
ncbi:MAG: hypothetical protein H6622_14245, partial [Halobacteriovoraceae bacterium]|nr:hypothetical protein [Halobacteriovoraceae bacterium]